MTPSKDHLPDEIREQILQAARERFRVYGFNKTTMAEIAKDCDMSAANLYRFYENKLDIAVNLACSCLADEEAELNDVVNKGTKSASERLKDFIFATLHHTHNQISETPHISELVNAVCQGRMDLVEQHFEHKTQTLIELIEFGNKNGEFDVADPQRAARAVLTATMMFDVPLLTSWFPLEVLEQKAGELTELLLNGLIKK